MVTVRRFAALAACGALAVVLAACAAGGKRSSATPASTEATTPDAAGGTSGTPAEVMPPTARTQIERLAAQVEQERVSLGLAEPSPLPVPGPATPMASVPLSTDASCKPARTERCQSTCKVSDSICTNAGRICELARDVGDTWAADTCARARQTCEAAHASCCSCQ